MKTFARKTILGVSLWALLSTSAMAAQGEEINTFFEEYALVGPHRTQVTATLDTLPASEVSSFLTQAEFALNGEDNADVKVSFVQALAQVEAGQRFSFAAQTQTILASVQDADTKRRILNALPGMEDSESFTTSFLSASATEKEALLDALTAVPTVTAPASAEAPTASLLETREQVMATYLANRSDVLVRAQMFITEEMSGYAKAQLINAIKLVPAGDRDDVLPRAQALMAEGMSGDHKAHLINAIKLVPAANRSDVLVRAQMFITEEMSGYEKAQLIDAIKLVPAGDRSDVLVRAQMFITEGMSGHEKAHLINTIKLVPAGDRSDVLVRAQMFITEGMSGHEKARLINAIKLVPAGDRSDVLVRAQMFITEGMSGNEKAHLIDAIKLVPAGDRSDVLVRAQMFITEGMSGNEKAHLIDAIKLVPAGDRDDVLVWAQMFITEEMSVYEKEDLISIVSEIDGPKRAAVCAATGLLFNQNRLFMGDDGDDIAQVLAAFVRIPEGVDLVVHAGRVQEALHRDIVSGHLMTTQVLSRILELIENPNAPLVALNLEVAGQEALTAERQPIYDFYRQATQKHDLMQEGMDKAPTFAAVAEDVGEVLEAALKQEGITEQQKFRYKTSLQGLAYLASIRGNFALGGFPTIQNIARQLHYVLKHQAPADQVMPYVVSNWDACRAHFTEAASFGTAGQFLGSDAGKQFVVNLRQTLTEGKGVLETRLQKPQLKWLKGLDRAMKAEIPAQDQLAPLTEALFTIMRGHVAAGKMLDPQTPHSRACADGVYLGLMRVFMEVPQFAQAAAGVQDVAVVNCAARRVG